MSSILSIAFTHEDLRPSTSTVVKYYAFAADQIPDGDQWTLSVVGRVSNMVENSLRIAVIVGDNPTDTVGTLVVEKTISPGPDGFFETTEGTLDPVALFGSSIRYLKICAFYTGSNSPYFKSHTISIVGSIIVPVSVNLSDVELLTHNSALLTFGNYLINNDVLKDINTYSVEPITTGNPVTITDVFTGTDLVTNKVILVFTDPTLGSAYNVTVEPTISYTDHTSPTLPAVFQFQDRRTKMDIQLQRLPNIYNTTPNSILRWVLQSVSQSDERIGGTRSDLLGAL
jgi:hypothetical protein